MLEKAREKIEALVDDNSFVEIGADATAIATDYNPVAPQEASDGVITGHGLVDGSLTFFYAQDEDVLGGSLGSAHIHKLKHLYDMAIRLGAPIVGFINSSGVRIQESFDVMENMAELCQVSQKASGRVPQILGIFGRCAGVLSVFASMHDFVYMTDDSQMFLQSPNALDSDVDTSTADYQYRVAGNVDEIGSELEMIWAMRTLLSTLPGSNREGGFVTGCIDDLNRGVLELETKRSSISDFCKEISDEHLFVPVKKGIYPEMSCGFIRLGGVTVGVIGNQAREEEDSPVLSAGGAMKAARFVRFCDAFDVPVLSLVNVSGYEKSLESESALPQAMAQLTSAFAGASIPKVTLLLKAAKGSAYLAMNPRQLGADLVYAYPDVEMEVMDARLAAQIIAADLPGDLNMIANDFAEKKSGVMNAARHGYINRILQFVDTRKYLIDAFGILYTKQVDHPRKHSSL